MGFAGGGEQMRGREREDWEENEWGEWIRMKFRFFFGGMIFAGGPHKVPLAKIIFF